MAEKKAIPAKNGGIFYPQQAGEPGQPGAGRKKNAFKEAIQRHAEGGGSVVVLDGLLVGKNAAGKEVVTKQRVRVQVTLPSVEAVVVKMFRKAAKKGDVAAARWLAETGWGKTVNLAGDEENPLGGGFAIILPDNKR